MYLRGGAGIRQCNLQLIRGYLLRFKRSVCYLLASDPAGKAAGITQSARLTGCAGWTDEMRRKEEANRRQIQQRENEDLFKYRK
jgi:hypothetical protein